MSTTALDKRITEDEVIAELEDGMTIGIGGWGSRRKPMALVRAILRSPVKDLTVVSYGGPEVGLLCKYGKVRKLVYGFVSLDSIPLEPHFRAARQKGEVAAWDLDEGMLQWGLYAAALRLPFLPTRAGLGSGVVDNHPELKTVRSPYKDGEELLAMPALELDAAFVHVHRADPAGNGMVLGPARYFDDLYARAAKKTYVSCEQLVDRGTLREHGPIEALTISRMSTHAVIETPTGAHFTECPPDYGRDEAFQKMYVKTAKDPDLWATFKQRFLDCESHQDYLAALRAHREAS